MPKFIEYKVRPITRYAVTRFDIEGPDPDGKDHKHSRQLGDYGSAEVAHEVAYALCKAEHERLGWPIGDERIQYPKHLEPAPAFLVQDR